MAKQKEHTEEECKINEIPNVKPDDDCGHYVKEGPGTKDIGGDLNSYTDDEKKAVVAGMPKHNLDQDVSHGPGVEK